MPDGAAPRPRRIREQALVQRDQERGGFAGAGLCLARDILAREGNRQGNGLHGRGADEAGIGDAASDFGNEIKRRECELGKVCL